MLTRQFQILLLEIPAAQSCDALGAQLVELAEQCAHGLSGVEAGNAVEWIEAARRPVLENDPRSRDPVGALAVDQVKQDLPRTPRVATFVHAGPVSRQIIEQV